MEKLREKYTDGSVIPVAIHYNDEMAVTSFSSTIQALGCGGGVVAYCYIYIYRSDIVGGMVFNHEFEVDFRTLCP